ncbi:MAG: rhodanese-like domain-containing protein [Roseivirga sp.]|nr:rhodanese-like domain-containing protein [Roseivirga sp.]
MTITSRFQLRYILPTGLLMIVITMVIFGSNIINSFGAYHGVKNCTSQEATSLLNDQALLILDVRQREEYEVSHLKGAVLADDVDFESLETDQRILVYCTVGFRSTELGTTLTNNGFSHIYNLDGGLIGWKNQGQPVYNQREQPTDSVHVYSGLFGFLLKNGLAVR